MAKYVMVHDITGSRDGVPWPRAGEPVPAKLPQDEIDTLLRNGAIREADGPEKPSVEKAVQRRVAEKRG